MSLLYLSNADVEFVEKIEKLTWSSYITTKSLPNIRQIELINKREFVIIVLDIHSETFIIHISALEVTKSIYPS